MWAMSGFRRMPHVWEVQEYDPRWVSDMQLASQLYAHQKNDSNVQTLAEKLWKAGKRLTGLGTKDG